MNAPLIPQRPGTRRLDLDPLLGMLFVLIDERRSVVVHVTCATHGEGTTTIARQLAAEAAASGWCKVALLDGDTAGRRGEAAMSPAPGEGLLDLFERGEEIRLRPGRIQGLPVAVGSLAAPGQAMSKLESARGLYGVLRDRYDLVVVDGVPVFSGQQGAVLASVADTTILVVEAERSQVATIVRARKSLEQLGATVLGVVLNKGRRRVPKFIGRWL